MPDEKEDDDDVKLPKVLLKLNAVAGSFFLPTLLIVLAINYPVKRYGLLTEKTIELINAPLIFLCCGLFFLTGYSGLKILNKILDFLKKIINNAK